MEWTSRVTAQVRVATRRATLSGKKDCDTSPVDKPNTTDNGVFVEPKSGLKSGGKSGGTTRF